LGLIPLFYTPGSLCVSLERSYAVVEVQDERKMTVPESRKVIAEEFGLSEIQVKEIEQEGLDAEWPPLGSENG
jgi:hypothetical protein